VVDNEIIFEKLRIIKENLAKLATLKDVPEDIFINDFQKYDSAKYNLQTSIEAMLDICNHIIARKAYEIPKTNAEAFRLLCRKNILDSGMEDTFMAMARFRNRVVHMYEQVDNCEIWRMVSERLGDFQIFIEDITRQITP
jgi:uncharacterized protein YutE (UPF0331/DUF86 family)